MFRWIRRLTKRKCYAHSIFYFCRLHLIKKKITFSFSFQFWKNILFFFSPGFHHPYYLSSARCLSIVFDFVESECHSFSLWLLPLRDIASTFASISLIFKCIDSLTNGLAMNEAKYRIITDYCTSNILTYITSNILTFLQLQEGHWQRLHFFFKY